MYKWFSLSSTRQRSEMAAIMLIVAIILGVGVVTNLPKEKTTLDIFTTDMSIRDIATKLEVTGKGLARELALPLNTPKKKPLGKLGIYQDQLDHAIEHILSHRSTSLKYYVFAAIVLFGLTYLTRFGRPDNASISERKLWYPRIPYIMCLLAAVLVCGFVLGKSPNPMEGTVKVFKSMVGLYPSIISKVIAFIFFIALVIIGNKLICGWACPFGALQELIYSLPILRKVKQWKAPFWLTNTIRGGLFCVVLLFLFGIVGSRKGFVIYHYLNPFNLFNLDFDHWLILLTVVVFLTLAFFTYRPFCQFICPFGLVSWIAEKLSLYRVIIDEEKCTKCGACIKACPLHAAKGKVENKIFSADCFSCSRCLNVCPVDAIHYCSIWSKRKKANKEPV
ncbi:MAG: 4Fe-4S binding protein [Phycisphaerae bacterium]|nr:4Fe-4S binding protein [Phycisphaerae bacterium]